MPSPGRSAGEFLSHSCTSLRAGIEGGSGVLHAIPHEIGGQRNNGRRVVPCPDFDDIIARRTATISSIGNSGGRDGIGHGGQRCTTLVYNDLQLAGTLPEVYLVRATVPISVWRGGNVESALHSADRDSVEQRAPRWHRHG